MGNSPPAPPPFHPEGQEGEARPERVPVVDYARARMLKEWVRPGGATAIGVISVVLGVLGVGVNVLGLVAVVVLFANSTLPPEDGEESVLAAPDAGAVSAYDGEWRRPHGMGRATVEAVVEAVRAERAPRPERVLMLRRLLAEFGGEIFPDAGVSPDPGRIRAAIVEWGRLAAGPDGRGTLGTEYFRTAAGLVLLDHESARFEPAWEAGRILRVDLERAWDGTGALRRNVVTVAEDMDTVYASVGQSPNGLQAAVLREYWSTHLPPKDYWQRTRPNARMVGDGARTLECDWIEAGRSIRIWVMADGRVVTNTGGRDPTTGELVPPPLLPGGRAMPGAGGRLVMSRWAGTGLLSNAVLDLLLAGTLVVCGARLLTGSPTAMSAHVRWAWASALSIVPGLWLSFRLMREWGMSRGDALPGIGVAVLLQLAYPVAVLMAARAKGIREYYDAVGGGVRALSSARRQAGRVRLETCLASVRGRRLLRGLASVASAVAALQVVVYGRGGHDRRLVWAIACLAVAGVVVTLLRRIGADTTEVT